MGMRRKARELALQLLYFTDIRECMDVKHFEIFCSNFKPPDDVLPFFQTLVKGVIDKKEHIDSIIEQFSEHWKLFRMSYVDRNVIRISVFELLFCEDIPPKVSLNEAIDIGKKFGTDESGSFINGILDSIHLAKQENKI